jgi:hypothetical protein
MDGDKPEGEHSEELQQRIRALAYLMWEAGGRQHGRALEYWLEAERRLLDESEKVGVPPAQGAPPNEPAPPEDAAA